MLNINLHLQISQLILFFVLITLSISFPTTPDTPNTSQNLRILSKCSQGTYYMDGTCMKVCPGKYFGFNNLCWACPKSCQSQLCLAQSVCNPCTAENKIYHPANKTCVTECPLGYFEDFHNKICVHCEKGCTTCTYPNGLCSSESANTSLIIYISVPIGILIITITAVYFWRKSRKTQKPRRKSRRSQQPIQDVEAPASPSKRNKLAQLKKFGDNNTPVGPYNVMPEDFNQVDETEEDENATSPGGRSKKRRLTNKLLTVSMSKAFQVDDCNDEYAITHGSAALKTKVESLTSLKGGESPAFRGRKLAKRGSRVIKEGATRQETQENRPLDLNEGESVAVQATSFNDLASPVGGLTPKRETPRGFTMMLRKMSGENEEEEGGKVIETEEHVDKIDEAEEGEEEDGERKEKEGYREDSSMNESREGMPDLASCTICGMNKIDCINKPCGHVVGCYACMKLFRESYGVCPKCKVHLRKLEKMGETKLKKSQFSHKEETMEVHV